MKLVTQWLLESVFIQVDRKSFCYYCYMKCQLIAHIWNLFIVLVMPCVADYKVLGILKRQFPNTPILGLTATSTDKVYCFLIKLPKLFHKRFYSLFLFFKHLCSWTKLYSSHRSVVRCCDRTEVWSLLCSALKPQLVWMGYGRRETLCDVHEQL